MKHMAWDLPQFASPDIPSGPLLQEGTNFVKFAATCTGIVKKIGEFARIGFNILDTLLIAWITFQDQDLVFRPT